LNETVLKWLLDVVKLFIKHFFIEKKGMLIFELTQEGKVF